MIKSMTILNAIIFAVILSLAVTAVADPLIARVAVTRVDTDIYL
jgi:hypothetical protein